MPKSYLKFNTKVRTNNISKVVNFVAVIAIILKMKIFPLFNHEIIILFTVHVIFSEFYFCWIVNLG